MLPLSDYLSAKQMALTNKEVKEALLLRMITSVLVIQCACDREIQKLLQSTSTHSYTLNNHIVHQPWLFQNIEASNDHGWDVGCGPTDPVLEKLYKQKSRYWRRKFEPCDNSAAGQLKRKVAAKKVAAEMALQMKNSNRNCSKSKTSDIYEHQLKLAEDILNFNVALSASLATSEQMKADEIRKNLRVKNENLRAKLREKEQQISRLEAQLSGLRLGHLGKEKGR